MATGAKRFVNILQEFSIPLIFGVICALIMANVNEHLYHDIVHTSFLGFSWFNLHFLVNDIFMVFFFGIAAKEISESFLPGGALNPVSKAINPLLATVGGVMGPIAVFFLLTAVFGQTHLNRGWAIPTATDIALAWLAAKLIFGAGHPAINFLLLLAIVDDAIGLGIIAIFYGDPNAPANPTALLWVLLAMVIAFALRKKNVQAWQLYIFGPGSLSWYGLHEAHLHPALALVAIVPFLPSDSKDKGLFVEESSEQYDEKKSQHPSHHHSPLEVFEHDLKFFVDFGLFFFAFANAGVGFSSVSPISWIVLTSLLVGKTLGISLFSLIGVKFGVPLPNGMNIKHLFVTGMIAGIGLTVALFVCGAAYNGELIAAQGPAKMGALLSVLAFAVAWIMAKTLKLKKI